MAGVGQIIDKADFNRVRDKVNLILGPASGGSFGYGQTLQSSPVSEQNKVSVNGWTKLQYDLITIARHQTGSVPTLPLPEEGKKIIFNSTSAPVNKFETFVADLENNRFTINEAYLTPSNNFATDKITVAWKSNLSIEATVTWASAENARRFFNLGGRIRISATKSGGTITGGAQTIKLQNESWQTLINEKVFDFKAVATSLTDSIDRQSWYRLDNDSITPFVTLTATGDYDQNQFRLYAWTDDSLDNRVGDARVLKIKWEFSDGHTPDGGSTLDGVDGDMSVRLQTINPNGDIYPSNTSFSIPPEPTFSFGSWTAS